MDRKQDAAYELDYIYLPQDSAEFESVHVSLKVGDERMVLVISSDKIIETADLEDIVAGLRNSTFKRMNLKYGKDCNVLFVAGQQKFNITFDENTYAVTGMKEVV